MTAPKQSKILNEAESFLKELPFSMGRLGEEPSSCFRQMKIASAPAVMPRILDMSGGATYGLFPLSCLNVDGRRERDSPRDT